MIDPKSHWEQVYTQRAPTEVSWYQANPTRSLELVRRCGLDREAAIIDVGGGASTLVDRLISAGFVRPAVLDISRRALGRAQERLGPLAKEVDWFEADVTRWVPPYPYDLWHDRAVFHFLAHPADRRRYLLTLEHVLRPGGHLIIATFGPNGPERCTGLPVVRYDTAGLLDVLGDRFELREEAEEEHLTPAGATQAFRFWRLQHVAAPAPMHVATRAD